MNSHNHINPDLFFCNPLLLRNSGNRFCYEVWLTAHQDKRVVFLEIGVGYNTPGIIKYSFWQQVYQNENAVYACLNMEALPVPEEIRDRSIVISGDSAQVIGELVS